jgi:serine/threonine protein kinase/tetratricopeptide (TPR) repeat protein
MEDLTGQTLGQYEITGLIGGGGMATVYQARQPRLKRDVAVKVMLPSLAADVTFQERFEREAQASANMRHPNILTVYDYGETGDGQLYLVVDYVRRGTLRKWLEEVTSPQQAGEGAGGPVSLEETVEIVAQVAEALDYAHRQGVIHRDVKPNNILLTRDGRPLLADFGLVKPIQGDRRLTASGIMLGTPDYIAPEQAQGLEVDGRADIYALGVMLFEMLTGRHPYAGELPFNIISKHVNEPMPRPSELNPDVSLLLDEVVAKATAKSPGERYQRAGDMARALRATLIPGPTPELGVQQLTLSDLVAPLPVSGPGSPVATPLPSKEHSRPSPLARTRVWVAVVFLALALAAALILLPSALSRDGGEEELAGAVPMAQPGKAMILIAQFKAQEGSERFDVSQRIYDKLSDDLRQLGEEDVTVYQIPQVIESSEAAVALGQQYGATTVLWGYYDDIGISPNVEAVGTMEDNPLSVGLERLNLEASEAVNFKLYIAKDLPEELSFLTAISLLQISVLQGRLVKMPTYLTLAENNLPADPQFRSGGDMVYLIQATMSFLLGDMEKALEQMNQAIAINSDEALFYIIRGNVYAGMGKADQAVADYDSALELDANYTLAHLAKGFTTWQQLGDFETALKLFDQVIEMEPDDLASYAPRAILSFEMGDLTQALADWERVKDIDPGDIDLPIFRGLVYEKMGQREQAQADYAQAREKSTPPDAIVQDLRLIVGERMPPYAYLFACTAYEVQGKIEQALASCDKALEADPDYFDALWKRGQLHAASGDLQAAISDYDSAIQADSRWPWVYFLRAQARIELGQTDDAQADLERALELEPVDELHRQIEALQEDDS